MRRDPLKLPSVRRLLVKIHTDLFTIHRFAIDYYSDGPLSRFEKMVILLEDRGFARHWGISVKSLARDLIKCIRRQRHGGFSTIDMQFVRTATGYRKRTVGRKSYEMLLALLIQFRYSKRQVLQSYLSCAFFGSKMKGQCEAARRAFGKDLVDLSIEEASELASMLVYPRPIKPSASWRQKVQRRAAYARALLGRFEQSCN